MRTELHDNGGSRRIPYRSWRWLSLWMARTLQPFLPQKVYMCWLVSVLRRYGMQIIGAPIYISPSCWFDGTDYRLITIEDQVVISSQVTVLTHDFSLARIRDALAGTRRLPEVVVVRSVRIGCNSFIGLGAVLMPGAEIGANCIVGAGSVVRGRVPDNSIVLGNPASVVGSSLEWGARRLREMGIDIP